MELYCLAIIKQTVPSTGVIGGADDDDEAPAAGQKSEQPQPPARAVRYLRSIRDLDASHLPMLRIVRDQVCLASVRSSSAACCCCVLWVLRLLLLLLLLLLTLSLSLCVVCFHVYFQGCEAISARWGVPRNQLRVVLSLSTAVCVCLSDEIGTFSFSFNLPHLQLSLHHHSLLDPPSAHAHTCNSSSICMCI